MSRSAFLFFKGLGLLFAILVGIGIAVLGWYDDSDWINIAFYSLASTALVLWGWYHFSIKWIHIDLGGDIITNDNYYYKKGATGKGTRLLMNYLLS